MKLAHFQNRIGKFILISNFLVFGLIGIFYVMSTPGFTEDELETILKFLVPIESVYMTAIIKFLLDNKTVDKGSGQVELSNRYTSITKLIIYGHITVLLALVIVKALGAISFDVFTNLMAIVETAFGAYVGTIVLDLFKRGEE